MFKRLFKRATLGQIILLVLLLSLLVYFLKDAGITTICIVVATAVLAGLILFPFSRVKAYDKEDLIDWDLVNYPSGKDD